MEFGLNLYSVRNLVGTPEGFRETAHKLKEMGYDTLQISGVPYDPELITAGNKGILMDEMISFNITNAFDNIAARTLGESRKLFDGIRRLRKLK